MPQKLTSSLQMSSGPMRDLASASHQWQQTPQGPVSGVAVHPHYAEFARNTFYENRVLSKRRISCTDDDVEMQEGQSCKRRPVSL